MAQSSDDMRAVLRVLKETLRARGHVYADVAKHLGVSEVTVKRTFSGEVPSMKHLLAICDFLHISLLEVADIARSAETQEHTLTEAQDRFFAKSPATYAAFIDLYRRKSEAEVKERWGLDDRSFFRLLRDLESIGLLDVLPENKYRFRISGPVKVPIRGRMRKVFFKQNIKFLEQVQDDVDQPRHVLHAAEVLISRERADAFIAEFEELAKRFRSGVFTDETVLPPKRKQSVRWLFAFCPYETNWRETEPALDLKTTGLANSGPSGSSRRGGPSVSKSKGSPRS